MQRINEIRELINSIKHVNPKITFLIGPPASGKSTWVSQNGNNAIIISRDDIVDKLRKLLGISYGEAFKNQELQNKVNAELQTHINNSLISGKDIVVDMTNMNKNSRSHILSKVPQNYTKNAVVFNVSRDELLNRLKTREEQTGKHVPIAVVDQMISNFQLPDKDEFDNISLI